MNITTAFRLAWISSAALAISIFVAAPAVKAATPNWIGPDGLANSGNWSAAGNWSPAAEPGAGDDVTIAPTNGNNVTVSYDYTGSAVTLHSLTLAAVSTSGGNVTLSMAGNNLTVDNEYVADGAPNDTHSTAATIDQSGGTNMLPSGSSNGNLYLGHDSTDTGTYKLSGTAVLSVGFTEYIGYDGVGMFNQTGGSNTTAHLNVGFGHSGDPGTSMGSYTLSNGSLTVNGEESVSLNVNGTFTQSGGTNSSTKLAIGNNQLGSTGLFTLSGGSVSTGTEVVGSQEGIGTLTQSGSSTNTISTELDVASDLGTETGTFNLNGGGVSAPAEYIGCNIATGIQGTMIQGGGVGTVSQTAGTNTVSGEVYVGASTDIGSSSGKYTISGTGVLTVGSMNIGTAGTLDINGGTINTGSLSHDSGSTFSWTAGTLNITTATTWDPAASSNSTSTILGSSFTLSSNETLGVTGNETVGGSAGGLHAFTLTANSSGANTVSGTIAVSSGSQLKLNGGTITAGALDLAFTPSRFSWTTGTLNFTNSVTLDPGGTSTTDVFGSSLNLSSNKILSVTGNETVGNNSFFNLIVSSGGANNVSGTLTVNPLSEMDINGGTVTAGTLHNIGPLNINSGTVTGGTVTLDSAGALSFGLSGTTRGTGYGALVATGNATLAGSLTVSLNGFMPAAGEAFDILDWGTRSGKFASLSLPSLPSGLVWSTLGLYSSGELIVANNTLLPGDFNRDGHVDARDIGPMMQALTNLSTYQSSHGNISTAQVDLIGDINGDGKFNNADLQALLNALTSGDGSTDSVPEPASWILASMALVMVSGTRFFVRCIRKPPILTRATKSRHNLTARRFDRFRRAVLVLLDSSD